MVKSGTIALSDIEWIKIYFNIKRRGNSKSGLKLLLNECGGDYLLNAAIFLRNGKPCCHLKADGEVKCNPGYKAWAISWNTPLDYCVKKAANSDKNYMECVHAIIDGKKNDPMNYGDDMKYPCHRTAFGVKDGKLAYYCTNNKLSPENLRDTLYAAGWSDAIMMDGGGSACYIDKSGACLPGDGRYIPFYIAIKLKQKEIEMVDNVIMIDSKYNIIQSYLTKNKRYTSQTKKAKNGYMQHSTGTPGAKAADFIKTWNSASASAETEFIIDDTGIYQLMPLNIRTWHCGGSGNNTHVGCEICEPKDAILLDANWRNLQLNSTGYAVGLLQKELAAWGYDPNGIDGIFGNGTKNAVISFQKAKNLSADGIVGKSTLHSLQSRNGSYLLYNNVQNQAYFEDVYTKAVITCAYILKQFNVQNIDKNNVLSHAEGYKLGIASNHADCDHLFKAHNKTMDDFRNDVKTYMNSGLLPYENNKTAEKNEVDVAWDKACDMGVFDGSNPTGAVTRRQLAVVLDRLKLLK